MASEKVNEEAARLSTVHRVEFQRQTMGAFLDAFMAAGEANDRMAAVLAAARLAQLCVCMEEEYELIVNELMESNEDSNAANAAALQVSKMSEKNLEESVTIVRSGTEQKKGNPLSN